MTTYIAHTKNALGKRHDLIDHLRTVADLAAEYAGQFGADELARYLGLWHDVGKFNPEFQDYLLRCETDPSAKGTGPDHKAAGSEIAMQHLGLLALLVQGHHGGLHAPSGPDSFESWFQRKKDEDGKGAAQAAIETARGLLPDLEPAGQLSLPPHVESDRVGTAAEMFLRLLFSALVDADCLDTEAHCNPEKAGLRGSSITMEELWSRLEASQASVKGQGSAEVFQARDEMYKACVQAADKPPGLFRLAVPTGGGKTRSGMAFALKHAMRYGHKRVIVAVPFISITEQTAQTYRDIFGSGEDDRPIVLEHHSGGQLEDSEDDYQPDKLWQRLASENWDAPVVVTTTVQLFESLFAKGTSRCRKLHRLARSVIILDEAQALPAHLLRPILDALSQLCRYYGATVVLSTATQPAFDTIPDFRDVPATEIVENAPHYFEILKRVEYEWRTDNTVSWDEIAATVKEERQALTIVNTKKDAIALLDALGDSDNTTLHLSTLLCGAHRRQVIADVKRRLDAGEPCHLVSTQVIEAGVDLDFPVVLRALGPLDGIIQAAGRCNREGKLDRGRVIVFQPEGGGMPPGAYRTGADITRALLGRGDLDPDNPKDSRIYFQRLFDTLNIDRESIQKLRSRLNYPEVARNFRMIDDDTESVVVAYGSAQQRHEVDGLLNRLRYGPPNARFALRRLQPYVVSLRKRQAQRDHDLIEPIVPGVGRWLGDYDQVRGLVGRLDPDMLVV